MAEVRAHGFNLPNEQGMREIIRRCDLSAAQTAVLRAALEVVAGRCAKLTAGPTDKAVKESLKQLDKAFARLEHSLGRQDVVAALRAIGTNGAMGYLFSDTAVQDFEPNMHHAISAADIHRLLLAKAYQNTSLTACELDALRLPERSRQLAGRSSDAMKFVVRTMRQPISAWLMASNQDAGGRRTLQNRAILIEVLACNAMEIIGQPASPSPTGKFMNLCVWVFQQCSIDTHGIEDALERHLARLRPGLEWQLLPAAVSEVGMLGEDEINAIPDDPEVPLK